MWKFSKYLPLKDRRNIATLGEGNTPMVRSSRIGASLGLNHLYFKLETQNPTGSYKDRFASVAASLMLENGKRRIVASSSGNTGSALAAYAARFGLRLELYVLEHCAQEKLLQASAFGAEIYRVRGLGASVEIEGELFRRLRTRSQSRNAVFLVSAFCTSPAEMQGTKTIAHEISEQMQVLPEHVFIPVGGGGLFLSCDRGFRECVEERGWADGLPRLHAVQPEGCATVVGPLSRQETRAKPVLCTSQISGLQVASLLDGQQVLEKVLRSRGSGQMVSDEEIYHWQTRLIREEGIYAEPAGAASLAGLASAVKKGLIQDQERVVCLVTGSGFKDTASVRSMVSSAELPLIEVMEI